MIAGIGLKEIAERLDASQSMTLDVSLAAKHCLAEKGYDIRYGARPLKRVLGSDILNPLSRLVLDGGVMEGDTVQVCTAGEAERMQQEKESLSWVSSSKYLEDKNSVVILRNHDAEKREDEIWDDKEFLMEDGLHTHR